MNSLQSQCPGKYGIPVMLALSLVLLLTSYSLPFMVIEKLFFFGEKTSLIQSLVGMWEEGFFLLTFIIFLFSIIFPLTKLVLLVWIWFKPLSAEMREKTLRVLAWLGKWSMLDVFVVAILIVLVKAKSFASAHPAMGIYVFAAAILLSMAVTTVVERLASRPRERVND